MTARIREWFETLEPRERRIVLFGLIIGAPALLYMVLIEPVQSAKNRAETRIQDQHALLAEVDLLAARYGPQTGIDGVPAGNGTAPAQSLVVLIDRTVRQQGLGPHLRRNQPDGQDSIRLRLESAPFETMVSWLADLESSHGLSPVSVTVDPTGTNGRVNSNIVLSIAGD